MYKVSIINKGVEKVIHYSTSDKNAPRLSDIKLTMAKNKVSIFTFNIYKNNVGYEDIIDLYTQIKIDDIVNNKIKFEGRILISNEVMDDSGKFYKEVTCESELSYFNDSLVDKWALYPSSLPTDAPTYSEPNHTIITALQKVITNHNNNTEEQKHFMVGIVDINYGIYLTTNYENSLDVILNKIVVDNNVVINIRKENGIRYLDIITDPTRVSNTVIRLNKNLKTFKRTPDYSTFCTRLIGVGADSITFESINNGKKYVENTEAISQFGIITKLFEWTEVTSLSVLKRKAEEKLIEILNNAYISLTVTALDLNCIGLTPEEFEVNTKYLVSNSVLNFREVLTVIQIDIDLLAPWNSSLTFSNKTVASSSKSKDIQKQLNINRNESIIYNDKLNQSINGFYGKIETYDEKLTKQQKYLIMGV